MITKGIARLLEAIMKSKGVPMEEAAKQLRKDMKAPSAKIMSQSVTKKHYSDAFNKARARINEMNMPAANKDDAVESLRTFYRNQHSEEMMRAASGRTYDIPPPVTPIPELVKQGLAFALGGGAGYAVGKNKEAITEMLKATKLPTKIDVDFGMTPAEEIFGGVEGSTINREDYILPYEDLFPEEEEPSLGTKTGNLLIDILSPIPRSWG